MDRRKKRDIVVSNEWLTSLVMKLTYPNCRHNTYSSLGDVDCKKCDTLWARKVRRARKGILAKLRGDKGIMAQRLAR